MKIRQTISAIRERKRSVLSNPEWKTVPWTQNQKTVKDILLDIMIDMPGLLEEFDKMEACADPDEREMRRKKLLEICWLFDRRLGEWSSRVNPPKWLGSLDYQKRDSVLVEDLAAAHVMTLYWAACVVLYKVMPLLVMPDEEPLPNRADLRIYFRNMARTVPIFLHPAVGMFRVHLATFPIAAALACLSSFGPDEMLVERRLLAGFFRRPEVSSMAKFLNSMDLEALESPEPKSTIGMAS
jgi:hypothetical protein